MVSIHLDENLKYFADAFDGSLDYICREFHISGTRAAIVTMEGLVNKQTLAPVSYTHLLRWNKYFTGKNAILWIYSNRM